MLFFFFFFFFKNFREACYSSESVWDDLNVVKRIKRFSICRSFDVKKRKMLE